MQLLACPRQHCNLRCFTARADTTMGQPRKIRNYEAESNPSEPMEVDDRGRLIIAMLKEARERMERTRRVSQALALQVRESQAHTQRLEENLKHFEARAQNAEGWVLRVQQEIQDVY